MLKKVWKITKQLTQLSLVVLVSFGISFGIYKSVTESNRFPSGDEMRSLDNISDNLGHKEAIAVNLSRHSILQVLSGYPDDQGFAKMSGTYVEHDNKFYVITAAHGIVCECDELYVSTDDNQIYDCLRYIIVDNDIDYAIIEIEQVKDREAVVLRRAMPRNSEWLSETSVLSKVVYTGYPNGLGPLTFEGAIAGVSDENYIMLHSYAWPGSSGSGVFSRNGNMIGIVIALNVGWTAAGIDVLEDLIIVTPLFMIDWDTAYDIMDEPPPSGDTGDTVE